MSSANNMSDHAQHNAMDKITPSYSQLAKANQNILSNKPFLRINDCEILLYKVEFDI